MQAEPTQRPIDREQFREQLRQTIEDARTAGQDAGRVTVIAPAAPAGVATTQPPWIPPDVPPRAADVAVSGMIMLAAIIIGFPIARALARRLDRTGLKPNVPVEVTSQLAQINQAVEAIAVEVERISEGQRFTTKLLAEQHKLPAASREIS
jgi:hypothetical protein